MSGTKRLPLSPHKVRKGTDIQSVATVQKNVWTKQTSNTSLLVADDMHNRIIEKHIYNANGDLSKDWYVDILYQSPTGEIRRLKKTKSINKHQTYEARMQAAQILESNIVTIVESGGSPFANYAEKAQHLDYVKHGVVKVHTKPNQTLRVYFEYFLDIKSSLRDKSFSTYKTKFRMMTSWLKQKKLDMMVPSMFNVEHANEFIKDLRSGLVTGTKVTNTTINAYIITFSNCWRLLKKHKSAVILHNPWEDVMRPRKDKPIIIPFSEEQLNKLFTHLKEEGDLDMLAVCRLVYRCFIRPGRELCGLQVKHIDLMQSKIWIPAEISKNWKTASVPMPLTMINYFHHLKISEARAEDYVFTGNGIGPKPASRDYWSKRFTKLRMRLKLPKGLTIYTLKHTGNLEAHLRNMPMVAQMQLNRHQDPGTTFAYLEGFNKTEAQSYDRYFTDL